MHTLRQEGLCNKQLKQILCFLAAMQLYCCLKAT